MKESNAQYYDPKVGDWVCFDPYILSQEVLLDRGTFKRVRQYISGHHPLLGKLHEGWTGAETVIERDIVRAHKVFGVDGPSTLERYRQSIRRNSVSVIEVVRETEILVEL